LQIPVKQKLDLQAAGRTLTMLMMMIIDEHWRMLFSIILSTLKIGK
jgi:hypothetical protein